MAKMVPQQRNVFALSVGADLTIGGRDAVARSETPLGNPRGIRYVYLHGSSGMGKTSLARHFLDELREMEPKVVILEGRCYERESVPYKALDGVVDSLTKYLLSLPEAKAEALMPREVLALARLFPVMLQVDSVSTRPAR